MASIPQILSRFWKGNKWSINEDLYATLDWRPGNPDPKPTEAEIRARSDEVDLLVAEDAKLTRQQKAMIDAPDYLLKALEIIVDGLYEIHRVIVAIDPSQTWDPDVVNRIVNLRTKIQQLRTIT